MAKVVTPITAKVEVIGNPKESSYRPGTYYYPTLFLDLAKPEGSDAAKIWKSLSGEEVTQIQKGDIVQLIPAGEDKNGKPKHNIVVTSPTATSPTVTAPQLSPSPGLEPDQKRAIAAYIDSRSDIYAFCLEIAAQKVGPSHDSETIRCMASTLFISTQRKFNL